MRKWKRARGWIAVYAKNSPSLRRPLPKNTQAGIQSTIQKKNLRSRAREKTQKSGIFCLLIHHTGTDKKATPTNIILPCFVATPLLQVAHIQRTRLHPLCIVNSEKFLQLFVCVASATIPAFFNSVFGRVVLLCPR